MFCGNTDAAEEVRRLCARRPASATVDGFSSGVTEAGSAEATLIVLEIACVVARGSDGLEREALVRGGTNVSR